MSERSAQVTTAPVDTKAVNTRIPSQSSKLPRNSRGKLARASELRITLLIVPGLRKLELLHEGFASAGNKTLGEAQVRISSVEVPKLYFNFKVGTRRHEVRSSNLKE